MVFQHIVDTCIFTSTLLLSRMLKEGALYHSTKPQTKEALKK